MQYILETIVEIGLALFLLGSMGALVTMLWIVVIKAWKGEL